MPKVFECYVCGKRPLAKDERVVSRHMGRAYCRDEEACRRRAKRNAKKQEGE